MSSASEQFDVIRAADPAPVVVEVPHAGTVIDDDAARFTRIPPKALAAGAVAADADLGADLMWEGLDSAGVTRVVARASRYVIDLNTDPHPPPQPPFYEEGLQSRSIIRRSHCGVSWQQPAVPISELERRMREVLEPYHAAVAEALERARAVHGVALLISSHTFPDRGTEIPNVVVGTQDGASADSELRDAIADVIRSHGLSVGLEKPFRGGWSLTRHRRPEHRVSAVQLEFARTLVTGGGATVSLEAVARLQRLVAGIVSVATRALRR